MFTHLWLNMNRHHSVRSSTLPLRQLKAKFDSVLVLRRLLPKKTYTISPSVHWGIVQPDCLGETFLRAVHFSADHHLMDNILLLFLKHCNPPSQPHQTQQWLKNHCSAFPSFSCNSEESVFPLNWRLLHEQASVHRKAWLFSVLYDALSPCLLFSEVGHVIGKKREKAQL